jgi:hypothetical protein
VTVFRPETRDPHIPPRLPFPHTESERLSDRHPDVNHIFNPILRYLAFWLGVDTSMSSITRVAEHIAEMHQLRIDGTDMEKARLLNKCPSAPSNRKMIDQFLARQMHYFNELLMH